jgi:spermidine synthase
MKALLDIKGKIIFLFFLSGISGLIYEIIWTRVLMNLLGSSIYAISIVLAVFMGGLAIGSLIFGKIIDNKSINIKLRFYAYIEIGIALSAGFSFYALPLIQKLYLVGFDLIIENSVFLTLLRFIISILILIIPTILIGATLPVLSKAFILNRENLSNDLGLLYGINTLGGVVGIAVSSFILIQKIGIDNTFFIAVFLNILIGLIVFLKSKEWEKESRVKPSRTKQKVKPLVKYIPTRKYSDRFYQLILVTYGISGLTALAFEVFWTRSLIFFIGSSTYAFSIILIIFLTGITLGSLFSAFLSKGIKDPIWTFAFLEILIGIFTLTSLFIFKQFSVEVSFNTNNLDPIFLSSLESSFFQLFLKAFIVVFPSTFLMGMLFPIINNIYIRHFETLGKGIGQVYSINTIGTIFGSIIASFVMIPLFGVSYSILFFSMINFLLGFIISIFTNRSLKIKGMLWVSPVLILVFIFLNNPFIKNFKSDTEKPTDKILFYKEDISATVKVYQDINGYKSISVNGMMIGGNQPKSIRKEIMLAHLPMLFHPEPKAVLTVGLGSGITLGELSLYKPDKLNCVEIVDAVKTAARYFKDDNSNILENNKANIIIEDGRNYLLTSGEKYDVIIDDSMLRRESAGNGPLYSFEYYKDCLNHLNEGGIFCQWLPLYLEKKTYQSILKTLKNNFQYVTLWYLGHSAVVQIATKNKLKINVDNLSKKLNNPSINHHLKLVEMDDPSTILKCMLLDNNELDKFSNKGEINSDNFPLVEFRVPLESGSEKTFSDNLLEMAPLRPKEIPSIFTFPDNTISNYIENNLKRNWNNFHYILSGSIFFHSGDIKNGFRYFMKALEIDPTDKHAIYFLEIGENEQISRREVSLLQIGNIFYSEKNIPRAIEYMQKSISIDSTFTNGYNALANLYFDIGETERAISLGEKAVQIIPYNTILLFNLGTYYEEAKYYQKAFDIYKRVLEIDPTNKSAKDGLENCKRNMNVYK